MKNESETFSWDWKQRYCEDFKTYPVAFRALKAEGLNNPSLVCVSEGAASCLGLTPNNFEERPEVFSACFAQGELLSEATGALQSTEVPKSIATAYAGHQFGVWAGQLGDGRALLLGDLPSVANSRDWGLEDIAASGYSETRAGAQLETGDRIEVQLKGSGQTPYSRMGDGRAVLRSSIREFLASEAMIALGVPSTRALCLYRSNDPVFRETTETAAILTRLAPSFLRFGHVEYFAHFEHHDALEQLLWVLAHRHYPEALQAPDSANGSDHSKTVNQSMRLADGAKLKLLKSIAARTGYLIAHWQSLGFCHGVMNTDNMSLLGLTIDYGPFGFLDQYDEDHVCNHSDYQGRYSYANQPAVGAWNCKALALAFRASLSEDAAKELPDCLNAYRDAYETAWQQRFAMKFGLMRTSGSWRHDDLREFLAQSMQMLQQCKPDFTLFFRRLSHCSIMDNRPPALLRDMVLDLAAFDQWWCAYVDLARSTVAHLAWDTDQRQHLMLSVNPKYILRNHLAEIAIARARGDHGAVDHDEIKRLHKVLANPFDEQPEFEHYAAEPPAWARTLSVSCSS